MPKTIWLFREQLTEAKLIKKLFDQFDDFLRKNGFSAKKGQIVDASIVAAPKQRNSREENKDIKNGNIPMTGLKTRNVRKIPMLAGQKRTDKIILATRIISM